MRSLVPIAFVGGFFLAGIVYASIPDSNGLIHGCYAKKGGGLRVIDSGTGQNCNTKQEAPVNWNRSGPPGPPGPSDAYTIGGSRQIFGDETHNTIASMSLPQGFFVISVVLRIAAQDTPRGAFVTCVNLQDGGPIQNGAGNMDVPQNAVVMMPLLGLAGIRNTASPLTLVCWDFGATVNIDAFVVATKIGAIHDL